MTKVPAPVMEPEVKSALFVAALSFRFWKMMVSPVKFAAPVGKVNVPPVNAVEDVLLPLGMIAPLLTVKVPVKARVKSRPSCCWSGVAHRQSGCSPQ